MPYRGKSKKDSGKRWVTSSGTGPQKITQIGFGSLPRNCLEVKSQQVSKEDLVCGESILFVLRRGLTSSYLWREPVFSSFLFLSSQEKLAGRASQRG